VVSLTSLQADSCRRNDPTPDRGAQLPRAAALITASLGFIHDLRAGHLEPDSVRGMPLDMDQYTRLFGVARIPTEVLLPSVFT
jgi:carnitine O-acetyltransferase